MAGSRLWKFPLDLDSNTNEYPHRITFQALKSRNTSTSPAPGSMVALYLPPDALKAAYSQSYGEMDMGAVGLAVADTTPQQAQNLVGAAMNLQGKDVLGQLDSMFEGSKIGTAVITGAAKEMIGKAGGQTGAAVQALQKKVGVIMNPHKAMIYQGPGGFRTFSYTFTMSPESLAEAEVVKNIVYFFKYHMHPGLAGVDTSTTGAPHGSTTTRTITENTGPDANINTSAALTYPEEFEIKMLINRASSRMGTNPPLFNIGKCVMESFNADYSTSGGPAFFSDGGEPVTTTISLGFKETVLMTKQMIRKGY